MSNEEKKPDAVDATVSLVIGVIMIIGVALTLSM